MPGRCGVRHEYSRTVKHSSMFHVADTSQTFAMTWAAGTHVILAGFRADAVAEAIERERITLTLLVPTMIGMLLDHIERHPRELSSLPLLMYAASPMPKETGPGRSERCTEAPPGTMNAEEIMGRHK